MELMQASRQWASRPDDQRFTSLDELNAFTSLQHQTSRATVVSSRRIEVRPDDQDDTKGLKVWGPNGHGYAPTHWSFGQIAGLAGAPAGYLRSLAAPLAADCLNYGLRFNREIEDVGVMLRLNGDADTTLAAATGPRYGRVWNDQITRQLTKRFGDGVTGDWRVPGEFGKAVDVTKANTTLYASDRDMFVFLADEVNRVTIPNRRDGRSGSLARGFFVWNSEVGSTTFGIAMFLFDYACKNRIVWGAEGYREVKFKHTASAPDRFLDGVAPVLRELRESSPRPIEQTLLAAQARKIDDVKEFLTKRRFTQATTAKVMGAFKADEGREMKTLWDVVTGVTAAARSLNHQDERVSLERAGGDILDLVAN